MSFWHVELTSGGAAVSYTPPDRMCLTLRSATVEGDAPASGGAYRLVMAADNHDGAPTTATLGLLRPSRDSENLALDISVLSPVTLSLVAAPGAKGSARVSLVGFLHPTGAIAPFGGAEEDDEDEDDDYAVGNDDDDDDDDDDDEDDDDEEEEEEDEEEPPARVAHRALTRTLPAAIGNAAADDDDECVFSSALSARS
jgi:hypothetical protein